MLRKLSEAIIATLKKLQLPEAAKPFPGAVLWNDLCLSKSILNVGFVAICVNL